MSARKPDYIVDISDLQAGRYGASAAGGSSGGGTDDGHTLRGRPWIAVLWKCCHVYSRVYRNAAGTLYEGRCPRCGRHTRARIGPDGINARFFEAR